MRVACGITLCAALTAVWPPTHATHAATQVERRATSHLLDEQIDNWMRRGFDRR